MCRCMSGFTDQFYEEVGTHARLALTMRSTAPAARPRHPARSAGGSVKGLGCRQRICGCWCAAADQASHNT